MEILSIKNNSWTVTVSKSEIEYLLPLQQISNRIEYNKLSTDFKNTV